MTVFFITGANKGLGRELARQILQDSTNKVIATTRHDVEDVIEESLGSAELQVTRNPRLTMLRLDYEAQETFDNLYQEVSKLGLTIDVFIACNSLTQENCSTDSTLNTPMHELIRFFKINTLGPLETLKVVRPFMVESAHKKVVFNSAHQHYGPLSLAKDALGQLCNELNRELMSEGFVVVHYQPNTEKKELEHEARRELTLILGS